MKHTYLSLLLIGFFFAAFTQKANAQLYVQMSDSAEVWSTPQEFTYRARTGIEGKVSVSVKYLKRKATTCMLELKVSNIGATEFRGWFKITANEMGELTSTVNSLSGNLKPGYWVSSKIEMRECSPKGGKAMADLQRCQACDPKVYFFGNIIKADL